MKTVGVIGLGDMGSGLAKNLIAAGFDVRGADLKPERCAAFAEMGGTLCETAAEVGRGADAVFIMVMNGDEVREVALGDGLLSSLKAGAGILLTATIRADEARGLAEALAGSGIDLIDSPVSGGFPGAQSGTLTMMASATPELLAKYRPVMEAVSATIHHVGTEPGMGQTMKACLQSLIGSIFTATFEASTLAAKAGVDPDAMIKVFSTSSAGCGLVTNALEQIVEARFEGTGSHINTMYKDMTISMDLARELGVPLYTAATAMQLFQAGKTRHPDGDNWAVTLLGEEITGAKLRRGS